MRLPNFEYFEPTTLEEALNLLNQYGNDAHLLAGGTDVLVKMRNGRLKPKALIGLQGIEELNGISFDPDKGLTVGANARITEVATNDHILKYYPALAHAAQVMANVQVRNMGTIVGNLCNAAPSAENAPPLMAMGGEVKLQKLGSNRSLPLDKFFKGPGITALDKGEIMTSVFAPVPAPKSGAAYKRISARCGVDIAAVSVGAMVSLDNATCTDVRLVLGAVAPVPLRAEAAENLLRGQKWSLELARNVALQAAEEAKPITDVRASADYRKKMVVVLTYRAVVEAYERAVKN
ncbi:MAG: FAD binding domain-containing protein [Desulfomonilaceae bacterium]